MRDKKATPERTEQRQRIRSTTIRIYIPPLASSFSPLFGRRENRAPALRHLRGGGGDRRRRRRNPIACSRNRK